MRLGTDFSSYGGPLNYPLLDCWAAQGVRFAGPQYSTLLPQFLTTLKNSPSTTGWSIEPYVYLFWRELDYWGTPAERVARCISMIKASGAIVRRIWIDAEDAAAGMSAAQLLDLIGEAVNAVEAAGYEAGIYTGRWWWIPYTGNSRRFAHLALWDAYYIHRLPDFDAWLPYGGWTRPEIWQWHDTTDLCGHSVDLNSLEDLAPPILEEDEVLMHVTISDAERGGAPFRSYLIGATTAQGFASRWVEGQEGFDAANLITGQAAVEEISLAELRWFKPSPDPLAP